MHLVALAFAKRGRQLPIGASEMNNETSTDTCRFNDRAGICGLVCPQGNGRKQENNSDQQKRCTLAAKKESGEHRILHGGIGTLREQARNPSGGSFALPKVAAKPSKR
jgi:hypothetical protein